MSSTSRDSVIKVDTNDESPGLDLAACNQTVGLLVSGTLVANGNADIMVPTVNSYLLAGHIPNAELIIYPDAGHGFLFQYPQDFAAEVNRFLNARGGSPRP